MAREGVQPGGLLGREHAGDGIARVTCRLRGSGPRAQGAAVGGQLLDVDHRQARRREHPLGGEQAEVGVVLVVDRVVLVALDEALEVGDLDAHDAVVGDQPTQPRAEVDDVGDVGEDVVGDDQVGAAVLLGDRGPGLLPEEGGLGGDPLVAGHLGDVGSGLHP